jgi:Glycosyl transferase family 2
LHSCFCQDYRPLEIDISDNSPTSETGEWVRAIPLPDGVTVRYWRNPPGTDPVHSYQVLLGAARGRRLLWMNDDDVILPGAVSSLADAFALAPDVIVSYGREQLINTDGEVLPERTAASEIEFQRLGAETGLRRDLLVCAYWQQISHVGYLIQTDAARRVGFRDRSEVGLAVDADFAIRLAQAYRGYAHVFVDRVTVQSRIGSSTLGQTSRDVAWKFYDLMRGTENLSPAESAALDRMLRRIQPLALREHSLVHGRLTALRILLSSPLRWSGSWARWVYSLGLIVMPNLALRTRHLAKNGQALWRLRGPLRAKHGRPPVSAPSALHPEQS